MPQMPNTPTPGETADYDDEHCSICGCMLDLESCWCCMGEGGWHDCGEDTCCCLDKDTIDDVCEECEGEGEYLACPNALHHPRQPEEPTHA